MLKLVITSANFSKPENRQYIVDFLSGTVDPSNQLHFEPYKPTENDDLRWTLDAGNNWWVSFDPEHWNQLTINYRYQNEETDAEGALAGWLKFAIKAKVIK